MLLRPGYKILPLVLILFTLGILLRRFNNDSMREGIAQINQIAKNANSNLSSGKAPPAAPPAIGAPVPPPPAQNVQEPLAGEIPLSGAIHDADEMRKPEVKPINPVTTDERPTSVSDPSAPVLGKPLNSARPPPAPAPRPLVKSFDQNRKLPPGVVEKEPVVNSWYHNRIKSVSTPDGKYFSVKMGRYPAYNPNILPHPYIGDQWVVVAQFERHKARDPAFIQIACNAAFTEDGSLECVTPPQIVPYNSTNHKAPEDDKIEDTWETKCSDNLAWLTFNVGPHDARAFYGPEFPYTTFGSNSEIICFSQWIQDLRSLYEAWDSKPIESYKDETEIVRPTLAGKVEKNYFIFWDNNDQPYVHLDSTPKRVFGKLNTDGTVGPDLASSAGPNDKMCLDKYMPLVGPELESIHQASNSLAVTLCKRADPSCKPTEENTVIISIFHWKSYYYMHGAYEPYVLIFKQSAPFELYGITKKALWIDGRREFNELTSGNIWRNFDPGALAKNHTEMIYVTSITWKTHGQKYHGYLDDVMFLGFGIEDSHAGAIDVYASDILTDIGLCSEL